MTDLLIHYWEFWYFIGIVFTMVVIFRHFREDLNDSLSKGTTGVMVIITVGGGIMWPVFWILVIIGEIKNYVNS